MCACQSGKIIGEAQKEANLNLQGHNILTKMRGCQCPEIRSGPLKELSVIAVAGLTILVRVKAAAD